MMPGGPLAGIPPCGFAPWGIIMPILAMFVTVLGFNLLGEGLRVSLDPRLRRRTF